MKKPVMRKAAAKKAIPQIVTATPPPFEVKVVKAKVQECCGLCQFWRDHCCKRYPPIWVAGDEQAVHRVRAHPADWCGEYQAR